MSILNFSDIAILPESGDNVAVVSQDLSAGTEIRFATEIVALPHTVIEGHRIVAEPILSGEPLLSWSTPFALARRNLLPGDYVCTAKSLESLRERGTTGLPDEPSATNVSLDPFALDESKLHFGDQIEPSEESQTFLGYARDHGRAGTRNHIAIVAMTSRSSSFVTELSKRFSESSSNFDGVVPVAHTEAGEDHRPNNLTFILTVLSGFLSHPNIGAVLIVDEPDGVVTSQDLRTFMADHEYPSISVPHAFFTRGKGFESDLSAAALLVEPWLPVVASQRRTEQPLRHLGIGLQCGGSDAFSGITANPLAGSVARELIRHGGAANLAETDELIGAEGYVLGNVRNFDVARRFLEKVELFKERVGWHGHSAEGNPTGGNIYRGLYNIVLKSVGAARKLDRGLRLDYVIDYGAPLPGPGLTFMDSPGNDLESVAGQVASGCNLIIFTTGNGSITNFPFVPTIKVVTTTRRYELLHREMDVNAGRYLTGTPMDELTTEVFDLVIRTASGAVTAGEESKQSQVSIWRDWKQTKPVQRVEIKVKGAVMESGGDLLSDLEDTDIGGAPIQPSTRRTLPAEANAKIPMFRVHDRRSPEQLALILPTSLCSGQIALRLAADADLHDWHHGKVTRTVSLPHTEGCGASGGSSENTYARTMTGYLAHPSVRMALLLEHGCEKTHNDYFRNRLVSAGLDPRQFGWASIQLDGGIDAVSERVRQWFDSTSSSLPVLERKSGDLGDLCVGLEAVGRLKLETARALANFGGWVVTKGGSVVLSSAGALLGNPDFRELAFGARATVAPTLAYGERPRHSGWHVMRAPTTNWLEICSGLGATGVQLLLVHVVGTGVTGQQLLPVVQITSDRSTEITIAQDLDATLRGDQNQQALDVLEIATAVASGKQTPKTLSSNNVGFQITRGLLGTSL